MALRKKLAGRKKQAYVKPKGAKQEKLELEGDGPPERKDTVETQITMLLPVKLEARDLVESQDELVATTKAIEDARGKYAEALSPLKASIKRNYVEIAAAAHNDGKNAGKKIAGLRETNRAIEGQIDTLTQQHKGKEAELEARADRLTSIITSGVEYHEVECTQIKIYTTKQVKVIRTDSRELVDERAMTLNEMQMEIGEE